MKKDGLFLCETQLVHNVFVGVNELPISAQYQQEFFSDRIVIMQGDFLFFLEYGEHFCLYRHIPSGRKFVSLTRL